jgi:hypothetical protein
MRSLIVTTTLAATAAFAHASTVSAQALSVELRGGLDRSVSEFRDPGGLEARGDAGFGGDLIFNVSEMLSIYGGYAWDRFGCDGCGDGEWITSRGFEGGAKILFGAAPFSGALSPWLRAGVVANKLKVDDGTFEVTSDTGIGFQAALGIDLPLGEVLSFSPAIRYQRFPAEFEGVGGIVVAEETVSYISLDFGLHIHPDFSGR